MPSAAASPKFSPSPLPVLRPVPAGLGTNGSKTNGLSATERFLQSDAFKPSHLVTGLAGGVALGQGASKLSGSAIFLGTTTALVGAATGDILTRNLYPGQADKRKHALVGGALAGVGGGITLALTGNRVVSSLAGLATGAVAGVAKEVYDKVSGRGTPDIHDFYATALGAATVSVTLTIPWR